MIGLTRRPRGSNPDAIDEFFVQWSALSHKLTMAGQPPNPEMYRSLFLQKVEPRAQFAAADFAIWKRLPTTDSNATDRCAHANVARDCSPHSSGASV